MIIPASKFTYPDSCYSFIARKNTEKKLLEIYFPPDVAIAADFKQWLDSNNYRQNKNNDRLFTAKFYLSSEADLDDIVSLAKKNGAIKLENDCDLSSLPDRAIKSDHQDLASMIAQRVNSLVEEKLQAILAQTAANQEAIARYEERLAKYEQQLKEREEKLDFLQQKLAEKESEINSFKSLFGGSKLPASPFLRVEEEGEGEEDTTHLNSPFSSNDTEVIDPDDYDDTEYNRNISPFNAEQSSNNKDKNVELDNIDLKDLSDISSIQSKKRSSFVLDLDSALDDIDLKQLEFTSNGNGKN